MKPAVATSLPKRGHFVVAVSGGVDSASLLHMLANQPDHNLRLRVVHVNHGLRPDAASDERFVRQLAKTYDLPFESVQLNLGSASEAAARQARYQFLFEQMQAAGARAIITAHHGDDQLETSIFNTLRGSGRHGQAAALKRSQVLRPLLALSKADLYDYAKRHGLAWRQDSTNADTNLSRNFIRHELTSADHSDRHRQLVDHHAKVNQLLDQRLTKLFSSFQTAAGLSVPRFWLAGESWAVVAAFWHFALRRLAPSEEFSRQQIEELARLSKTAAAGTILTLGSLKLQIGYDKVAIAVASAGPVVLAKIGLTAQTTVKYGPFWLSFGSHQDASSHHITLPQASYWARTATAGDRLQTPAGTKKVQDIFVDAKVPRDLRSQWPVITDESDRILWLPQLAFDATLDPAAEGYQLIAEEA